MAKHPTGDYSKYKDGFMTSEGRFVSREEALKIASIAKQLKNKGLSEDIIGLLSEDLAR